MKVKSYIATLILLFLFSGVALAYLIITEYKAFYKLADKYTLYEYSLRDLQRAETEISSLMTSIDLLLGSGQTYLATKVNNTSQQIIATLVLSNRNVLPQSIIYKIDEAILAIKQLNQLAVNASYPETPYSTEQIKQKTFNEYLHAADAISSDLISYFPIILEHLYNYTENNDKQLKQNKKELESNVFLIISIYLIFIVLLWIWISRMISHPIELLTQSTINANDKVNEQYSVEITQGPSEVIDLSKHFEGLLVNLKHQATHDPLTSLYNRRVLNNRLNEVFINWKNYKQDAVLCYVDLDQFKLVNDSCGHAAGDKLLERIGRLLIKNVRKLDLVVRMGGDEFCLLLNACDEDVAMQIANKIRYEIENLYFQWANQNFRISCSIGIARMSDAFSDINELINAADSACSLAKDCGKNRVYQYDISDTQLNNKRNDIIFVNQLNEALDLNNFELFRQGIFPIDSIVPAKKYYEVLVRMRTRDEKLLSPGSFIPAAERYHLASKIDKWVINKTIDWLMADLNELEQLSLCSINLSAQSLCNIDVLEFIQQKIHEANFPANKLCFEITETAVVSNINEANTFIYELRKLGCKFALDDFGSGLSSFAYLKELHVDTLKIDGCFVKGLASDPFDFAAVKSINEIAKSCGLNTVAEFVDSKEIVEKLQIIGVDFMQGYYFEKPYPVLSVGSNQNEQLMHLRYN